jgi:hypothetical protein
MKQREGEVTDRFLVNFVEHQISRIEVSRTAILSFMNFGGQELTWDFLCRRVSPP